MKPVDAVAELYRQHAPENSFADDVRAYMAAGYVISTPEVFIMGRAVSRSGTFEQIIDPTHEFADEEKDTWLISVFAGQSRNFLQFLPYPLMWLAWSRRNGPLRFYEFDRVIETCARVTHSKTRFLNEAPVILTHRKPAFPKLNR